MKASINRRDVYKRTAVEEGWRARSAYKIMQINETLHIFDGKTKIVDLCAAPGSWSQVAAKMTDSKIIVAIDLRQIKPIDGVIQIKGDITSEETARDVIRRFNGEKADVVMSDPAPDCVGRIEFDEYFQHGLVRASLAIATMLLDDGGIFVSKIFRTRHIDSVLAQIGCFFSEVYIAKPRASRLSSVESFVVAKGFKCPEGYAPSLITANLPSGDVPDAKFVCCGDLYGFDSERTYPLDED